MKTTRENYWKRVVALVFAGWLVIWVYRTMLTPVFDEIQRTVGPQTGVAMGLISSFYFLGYICTQIPGGMLMDRVGRKVVLASSFALFGVGLLVVATAQTITMLYAGSAISGFVTGGYYSGAFSLSAQNAPAEKKFFGTAMANSGCAVGMIGGLLASSILIKQAELPWQWTVYAVAGLAFAMSPTIALVLKDDKPQPKATLKDKAGPWGSFFTLPLVSCYFFYFATCYGYYMIVTWLPSFLEAERGITGTAVGLTTSIVAAASIPGALFFGKIVDRFDQHKTAILTALQLLGALMLVLTASLRSLVPLMICLGLYGITGKQAVDALIVPHVSNLNRGGSLSTRLGVFNFFGMSSSVLAPFLTGLICDAFGSRVLGFFLAAALLCASTLLLCLVNRKTSH